MRGLGSSAFDYRLRRRISQRWKASVEQLDLQVLEPDVRASDAVAEPGDPPAGPPGCRRYVTMWTSLLAAAVSTFICLDFHIDNRQE
jgi:hypothetical protein